MRVILVGVWGCLFLLPRSLFTPPTLFLLLPLSQPPPAPYKKYGGGIVGHTHKKDVLTKKGCGEAMTTRHPFFMVGAGESDRGSNSVGGCVQVQIDVRYATLVHQRRNG